jgi:MFS family permease
MLAIVTANGGPLSALSVRPFRWWFIGQITSASGLMTQIVATSWLVLQWRNSGLDLALVSVASMTPVLVLSLWAGSLVDHLDRRRLLICTQGLMAIFSLVLFVLITTGAATYWLIIVISALTGVVNAADMPARQVYVMDLVGEQRLAGAVSLYEVVLNASRVLGPALGGALLAISGPGACVLVNSVTFLGPLAVLLRYRTTSNVTHRERNQIRPKVREGVRYAWSDPAIRACLLLAAATCALFNPTVMLPLLAHRVFHMGGGGYGLLLALFGVGALPGALLAARGASPPTGRKVRALAVLTGLCMIVTAYAPDRAVLFIGMAAVGASSIWMIAVANTLVQLRTAPELRGRVMGAWSMALPGMVPITSLISGTLADACGARLAYGATGAVIAAIALICWRSFAREPRRISKVPGGDPVSPSKPPASERVIV